MSMLAAAGIMGGATLAGSGINYFSNRSYSKKQEELANRNIDLQKEFAKNGISWKVADAKRNGISPLAALGAQTHSFSPISVGGGPNDAIGNGLQAMGQNISRAMMAQATKEEKITSELRIQNMRLQNQDLENRVMASGIALRKMTGPGLPSNSGLPGSMVGAGQGDAYVQEIPLRRTHSPQGKPHQEVGHVADVGWARTKTGLAPVPSADVKEKIEDQIIPETMWAIRNQIAPNYRAFVGGQDKPSKKLLPKGYSDWEWSYTSQEFQPVKYRSSSTLNKLKNWYKNSKWGWSPYFK